MPRIQIALPTDWVFETTLPVRIGDINYGGHMGNDAVLRLAHEARLQCLKHYGYSELDIEGCGLIMADAAVVYKAEAFHGDALRFEVGFADFNKYGCDIVYLATRADTGQEVARIKTGIVFFDYGARKVARMPEAFARRFAPPTTAATEQGTAS
ncbi:acyl-CoA thioesterase [Gulbenkiania mobilis]|uniref:Acyl-CoA thioesterase FadM n=1 Tax=Gulbenkiania mobilis TaxID=397457 RepID=A0ABY2CVX6_GULMO|nr:thioesterase family protein [Gulbenkiania mobilis]TCW31384.1 acyl-CoA thioesterase FadM [Gulbenkiania mobilis]